MGELICRLLKERPHPTDEQPGDMWFAPWYLQRPEDELTFWLSPEYVSGNIKTRPPVILVLPGGAHWLIDGNASGSKSGWKVSGIPPKITARPSIKTSEYHGWLTDGVLKGC